ncbi:MAG: TIGR02444 family protein [Gemmatimonas sp.]
MDFPKNAFWDFALKVYAAPGVSQACLEVQERLGVDVNVLLFCLWVGESGRGAMTAGALSHSRDSVGAWHEGVVKKLRAVRRALKQDSFGAPNELAASFRAEIQGREIDAEHIEQLVLAGSVADMVPDGSRPADARAEDAVANVGTYLVQLNASLMGVDRAALATIVAAACPAMPKAKAETALSQHAPITF